MGQPTMKYLRGWTRRQEPAPPWNCPTQPKHACRPHKQRHHVRDCDRDLAVGTFDLARVRSPIAVEELRIPMSALLSLQPRFPFGGLTISRCVDALTRQDLLDPLPYVRRHICGDWGDVRAEHRRYNDAALKLGGYLLSSYVISDGLDLCVFTQADRNLTAVFLLDEY